MILAILRAQFLSLRGWGLAKSAGPWLAAIPAFVFYVFWTAAAVTVQWTCSTITEPATLLAGLTGGFFAVFLYWQIAPVITSSMGASLDLQKLVVYPIDLDKLFVVEVLLRLFTVGEMLVLLCGAAIGILRNPVFGRWAALPRLLLAFPAFVLFNLFVAAGVRSTIEQFFRRRRAKELGMLAFVLLAGAPSLLLRSRISFSRIAPFLPFNVAWPWGASGRIALGEVVIAAVAAAWMALAYFWGRHQFYRALRTDPYAGSKPSPARSLNHLIDGFFRLPGRFFRDPVAAIVEKELRSLSLLRVPPHLRHGIHFRPADLSAAVVPGQKFRIVPG